MSNSTPTRLRELFDKYGQSAWLDDLDRRWLESGALSDWVDRGVRGITSNPTIFAHAMSSSDVYTEELRQLVSAGTSVEDAYWTLAEADVGNAADVLRPIYDASGGVDGMVSIEVDPKLANNTDDTIAMARDIFGRLNRPNIFIKVPATPEGIPAIRTLVGDGINVNVTLLFSLERYAAVREAYLAGLESRSGDLSGQSSVASFFVSRVDTEVDRRLEAIGTPDALALRGKAAVAQAQVAYDDFLRTFAGARWDELTKRNAKLQRPLWASTSTKNDAYPDTLYVDELIGPNTVNTAPEKTLEAFLDHGRLARTVDADPAAAHGTLARLREVGIDLDDVTDKLEHDGVASFAKSFDEVLQTLQSQVDKLK